MRRAARRSLAVAALAAAALACDTMTSDRMVIRAPSGQPSQQASADELLVLVHETLAAADLKNVGESCGVETWRWKGVKPPGLAVTVQRVGDGVQVRLAQDLYGPIGPTDKYKSLKATLRQAARERFGKASMDLK